MRGAAVNAVARLNYDLGIPLSLEELDIKHDEIPKMHMPFITRAEAAHTYEAGPEYPKQFPQIERGRDGSWTSLAK